MTDMNHKTILEAGSINGIKFTPREIDILACILSGRTAKKIASFLSLSPKTVENYIHNISIKLECNSRESIIDFLEASDKVHLLKQHYSELVCQFAFEQKLKEVSKKVGDVGPSCSLILWTESSDISQLEQPLKAAGVIVTLETRCIPCTMSSLMKEIQSLTSRYALYVIPNILREELEKNEGIKASQESQDQNESSTNALLFVIDKKKRVLLSLDQKTYLASLIEILKVLFPGFNFDDLITQLDQNGKTSFLQTPTKEEKSIKSLSKRRSWLALFGLLVLIMLSCTGLLIYKWGYYYTAQRQTVIRSDLAIPSESSFLSRPELLAKIEKKLTEQKGIQTIALIAPGGAGKTTLARQFAHAQKANVIWEINAETHEMLNSSFEALSQALAQTDEDQKLLKEIQNIKPMNKREDRITQFVKERLRSHSDWVLIFDNVEKFSDIQTHFPQDSATWGQGKVILATRDSNIQNNKHIGSTLQIEELTPQQKLALFSKIMSGGKENVFSHAQTEEAKIFLEKLPPFPLDVSIAAYYLKTTNITYSEYLDNLTHDNQDFTIVQESLLKEAGDYTKTRYGIVALSLNKLIDTNNDFRDLLLLVSLIDSQNIPRDLLVKYKDHTIVDNFIYNLKKYSLVTDTSSDSSEATLSFHRSIQEIILAYISRRVRLDSNNEILKNISHVLEVHTNDIIEKGNTIKIRRFKEHLEKFLTHNHLLNESNKATLATNLGYMYFILNDYINSRIYLEKNIATLNSLKNKDDMLLARTLSFLGNTYRTLGNYVAAKDSLEKSISLYKHHLPNNQLEYSRSLFYLGNVYRDLGDYGQAKNLLEMCIDINKHQSPKEDFLLSEPLTPLSHLAIVHSYLGNHKKARDLLEQSLEISKRNFSEVHFKVAHILVLLGITHGDLGNYEEAAKLLEESLVIYKKDKYENNSAVAFALTNLGNIYRKMGKFEKAKPLLKNALEMYKAYCPENTMRIANAKVNLGIFEGEIGNYITAKTLLKEALVVYQSLHGESNIFLAHIILDLGRVYLMEGELDNANNFLSKALGIYQNNNHPEKYAALESLGDLYFKKASLTVNTQGLFRDQAYNYLKQAYDIVKAHFPEDSAHIKKIKEKLAKVQV
jgi:tetratricopeptide (TPR) repeat protein/DNA-binding CsgD family transcriptional regulator